MWITKYRYAVLGGEVGERVKWPSLAVVLLAFSVGILVDRIKPGRVVIISLVIWTMVDIHAFFSLRRKARCSSFWE